MKKIFLVYHEYGVDGGIGDYVCSEDVVAVFDNEEMATKFVECHTNQHIYDTPYDDLDCGLLTASALYVSDSVDEAMEGLRKYTDKFNGRFRVKCCGPIFKNLEVN